MIFGYSLSKRGPWRGRQHYKEEMHCIGVDDADPRDITACHRLKQSENSGVIIRLCDLSQRNRWLAGARNLQRHPGKISVSPDLLPVLRSLKNDLLVKRKGLPPADTAQSRINYISRWPYVTLAVAGKPLQQAEVSIDSIVQQVIGFRL